MTNYPEYPGDSIEPTQPDKNDQVLTLVGALVEKFEALSKEVSDIKSDGRIVRVQVDRLVERQNDMGGYSKEIDHILSEISRIKQHVNIE